MCGERNRQHREANRLHGSSPRVRGTRPRQRGRPATKRFIPACAGNAACLMSSPRHSAVHPRVCGERARTKRTAGLGSGSSPRVRGTLADERRERPVDRFIPACAGNAGSPPPSPSLPTVHPRVCGERTGRWREWWPGCGSSPRVRGTRFCGAVAGPGRRFIPACAGNATESPIRFPARSVHPRVCGERRWTAARGWTSAGSSPRVRGTPSGDRADRRNLRFIPACAGNAASPAIWRCSTTVHPRVCGERATIACRPPGSHGSSPRVRGTPRPPQGWYGAVRFIPACAGNAAATRDRPRGPSVHPRVCGERRGYRYTVKSHLGSSPRVRGTRLRLGIRLGIRRFIPACAGNARSARMRGSPRSVHPRVCGERLSKEAVGVSASGSSPRVRGTHPDGLPTRGDFRFIPACAGNAGHRCTKRGWTSVHPRVCGERALPPWLREIGIGSSPRVRGTRRGSAAGGAVVRFIPACAGNAPRRPGRPRSTAVHPRVCGERKVTAIIRARGAGSSPRVRGTLKLDAVIRHTERFIPACAGNAITTSVAAAGATVHPRVCGERLQPTSKNSRVSGSSPRVRGTRRATSQAIFRATVHPRVCGERPASSSSRSCTTGSSPRVRGTQLTATAHPANRRFIPACAGNAPSPGSSPGPGPVHPRVCGERTAWNGSAAKIVGSSPRVRGTRLDPAEEEPLFRFIPACAGNAPEPPSIATAGTVHPRVCGERECRARRLVRSSGSSPRVRGTRRRRRRASCTPRFIPACAGNASGRRPEASLPPVHPRVCGERSQGRSFAAAICGSSPRVRGTLDAADRAVACVRFIPACAGNAPSRGQSSKIITVHPRVCGERAAHRRLFFFAGGSSPRVRGTRVGPVAEKHQPRFIPACAGNASPPRPSISTSTVHPRVCGERRAASPSGDPSCGSSPRVRGTPSETHSKARSTRFIPACAGNAAISA